MAVKRPTRPALVEPTAPRTPRPRPLAPKGPPRRVYSGARHLRAALVFLAASVLFLAVAYPVALVEFGELVDPAVANGSLTYNPNGSVNGSSNLPPNTSATYGGPQVVPGVGSSPALLLSGFAPSSGESLSYRAAHDPGMPRIAGSEPRARG